MAWDKVRKLIDTILAGEDFTRSLLEYEKLMKEGQPFYAWQRAIHLAAVASLEELKQDPKEHPYPEEQRLAALKKYERSIGFPKEEDLSELESAIKETW